MSRIQNEIVVRPLTDADRAAISAWRYPGELAIYDPGRGAFELHEPDHVALVSKAGGLVGYGTVGTEAQVPGGAYDGGPDVVDIGLGLRPDLLGRGLGRDALRVLIAEVGARLPVQRLRATVAAANARATALVVGLGFGATHRFRRASDGREFVQYERESEAKRRGSSVGPAVPPGGGDRRARRRLRFDEVADLYAQVRPGYPSALFDDVWHLAALGDAARVLEIGCGSGQATLPLLDRGASVVAVEIGPSLAELARTATLNYGDRATIITADFDGWTPPEAEFDLAVAATAFHWLDPATRCERINRSLRARGYLAVISNEHVSDGKGDAFFHASQVAYARVFGDSHVGLRSAKDLVPAPFDDALFDLCAYRVYPWTQSFDSRSYIRTLATYSDHRDLPEASRESLFAELASIIDDEMGGEIEKAWAACLTLVRRK